MHLTIVGHIVKSTSKKKGFYIETKRGQKLHLKSTPKILKELDPLNGKIVKIEGELTHFTNDKKCFKPQRITEFDPVTSKKMAVMVSRPIIAADW